jgi:aryl-alcohol dehydrogenase-like predicted oxidoreductase
MKTNVLENSDLAITSVGFAAWAIGGDWEFTFKGGARRTSESFAS